MNTIDLRMTNWRNAILEIAQAVKNCPLTNRALALLIADCSDVTITQVKEVLEAIPRLKQRYLKEEKKTS